MSTYIKDAVYLFFAAIGKMDYLVGMRKRRQLPKELWLSEVSVNI